MTTTVSLVVLALLGAVLVWGVAVFNRLVRLRNLVRNGWADVDVQLMRRHDLVPRLVEVVQAYADYERATLESVTALRSAALAETAPSRLATVEADLEAALARVVALQERYPELAANDRFGELQRELVEVEDTLQFARRFYNGAVRDLNDGVAQFPAVLVARLCGFEPGEFYEADPAGRNAAAVSLGA